MNIKGRFQDYIEYNLKSTKFCFFLGKYRFEQYKFFPIAKRNNSFSSALLKIEKPFVTHRNHLYIIVVCICFFLIGSLHVIDVKVLVKFIHCECNVNEYNCWSGKYPCQEQESPHKLWNSTQLKIMKIDHWLSFQ